MEGRKQVKISGKMTLEFSAIIKLSDSEMERLREDPMLAYKDHIKEALICELNEMDIIEILIDDIEGFGFNESVQHCPRKSDSLRRS